MKGGREKIIYSPRIDSIDFAAAHKWLTATYWSRGISRKRIEQGFRASTAVVSAHLGGIMKGIARCLCDTTRFGYIADVFVAEDARNRGIASAMVRDLMGRPELCETDHWYLMTKDAHGVYAKLGFKPIDKPERFMRRDRK